MIVDVIVAQSLDMDKDDEVSYRAVKVPAMRSFSGRHVASSGSLTFIVHLEPAADSSFRQLLQSWTQKVIGSTFPDSTHLFSPHVSVSSFFTINPGPLHPVRVRDMLRNALLQTVHEISSPEAHDVTGEVVASEVVARTPVRLTLEESRDTENLSPVLKEWGGRVLATSSGYLLVPLRWPGIDSAWIIDAMTRHLQQQIGDSPVLFAPTRSSCTEFSPKASVGIRSKKGRHMSLASGRTPEQLLALGGIFAEVGLSSISKQNFAAVNTETQHWDLVLKELLAEGTHPPDMHQFRDVLRVRKFAQSV
ncbi:MAG: uncharacterized protein KVP18_004976 [Porospora cf. gigantea A]|uniref:uncharacterized protein n=1 Tax=Porospora cf. gigantea A TaxID=2853593 RepID=UPI003559492F|nr:MAG: hypothetical protein KVP18_004976 [Porospora cf. gigantea A]